MCDITDKEFERIYLPVCINYDNYLKEFVIPDVVAFYNVSCDIDKLIPSIKKILRIKYNLKIVKDNPLILKKFY